MGKEKVIKSEGLNNNLIVFLERCQHLLDNPVMILGNLRDKFMNFRFEIGNGEIKPDKSLVDALTKETNVTFSEIQQKIETVLSELKGFQQRG